MIRVDRNEPPSSSSSSTRWLRPAVLVLLATMSFATIALPAFADEPSPSRDDVLRAISKNLDEPNNSSGILFAVLAVVGGLAIILVIFSRREKREATPKSLAHHGKLLKEILKAGLPLKPAEIKQLKLLAEFEHAGADPDPALANPLTLLLCPSVLAKRLKSPPPKLDRRILSQVVKKFSAARTAAASERN